MRESAVLHRHVIIISVLLLAGLFSGALWADTSSAEYDVSYLWHTERDQVEEYRQRVAGILGARAAKDLKVVSRSGLYGLIYDRKGGIEGAKRVARAHTRLLQSRGLEEAAPIRSADWDSLRSGSIAKGSAATGSAVSREKPSRKHSVAQRKSQMSSLETALEDYIKKLRRQGKISSDERTGWSVFDITTGEKLVTINDNMQFQAASLIKPFVAAAFFHKVKNKQLIYGSRSRRHMERMIQHSSNRSTNWVMRHVGGPRAVQALLQKHYPAIFKDLDLVEYIPRGGRTYRNKASISDYSRFLYALWNNELPAASEIKRLMALPGADRLYTGVEDLPAGTQVYNKTGSTSRVCGDMGILIVKGKNGKRYPYILIGVIEKQNRARPYTTWIRSRGDVIRNVSNLVYQDIAERHNL